mgnify:CR=1 FL=1
MILDSIGYIICESAIAGFTDTNIVKEENGKVIAEGILQTANERNRNGRFYSSEELFPQLTAPRTLELLEAGYLRAELGHPLSNELVRQQTIDDSRTCAQFLKLWTEGDHVWARFRGTNNAFGEAFDKDLKDGCKPAWSLRALGNLVQTPRGAEVRKLKVITWDQVIYPSHPGAYTQRLVTESVGYDLQSDLENKARIIPVTNQKVIDYIRSESANLKFVKENFDFMYDSITVNEDATSVSLTCHNGDILVVNLESYIHNEIMTYGANQDIIR